MSNAWTQEIILGCNSIKAFHIGTAWNKDNEKYLTRDGKPIATIIGARVSNAHVQCAESITIPPRTNAVVKCKVPKILLEKHFEKFASFKPSNRHRSDNSDCHTYNGPVVMDDEVRNLGIFLHCNGQSIW